MKGTELQIGDWVRYKANYPDKSLQRKICQVEGNHGRIDVRTLDGCYHESEHPDWLEGVELKSEHLLTNEWTVDRYGIIRMEQSNPERRAKWNPESHICEVTRDDSTYSTRRRKKLVSKYVDYVHELQHALRLCEIEKEIVL